MAALKSSVDGVGQESDDRLARRVKAVWRERDKLQQVASDPTTNAAEDWIRSHLPSKPMAAESVADGFFIQFLLVAKWYFYYFYLDFGISSPGRICVL